MAFPSGTVSSWPLSWMWEESVIGYLNISFFYYNAQYRQKPILHSCKIESSVWQFCSFYTYSVTLNQESSWTDWFVFFSAHATKAAVYIIYNMMFQRYDCWGDTLKKLVNCNDLLIPAMPYKIIGAHWKYFCLIDQATRACFDCFDVIDKWSGLACRYNVKQLDDLLIFGQMEIRILHH